MPSYATIEGMPGITTLKMVGNGWNGSALRYDGGLGAIADLVWAPGPGTFCETAAQTTNAATNEQASQFQAGDWCLIQSANSDGSLSWTQHSQLYDVTPPWLNWQNPLTIPVGSDCSVRTASKFNPVKNITVNGVVFDASDAHGTQVSAISGNFSQDANFEDIIVLNTQNAGIEGWGDLRPHYKNIRVSGGGTPGDASHYFWKQTDGVYDNFVAEGLVFGPTFNQCHGVSGRGWRSYHNRGRNIKLVSLMYSNISDIETNYANDTGLSIQGGCGVLRLSKVSATANGINGPVGDQWGVAIQTPGSRFITFRDVHSVANTGYDICVSVGNSDTLIDGAVYGTGKLIDNGTRTVIVNTRTVP